MLCYGAGTQLVNVRTERGLYCLFVTVDESACEKVFVKVSADSQIKTLEFRYRPRLVFEDKSQMRLGRLQLGETGKW